MQDEVTVTQADREAAYGAYFECYDTAPNDLWLQAMLEGRHDEDSLIQVLARHRQASTQELVEALALALSIAESWIHDQLDGTSHVEDALAQLSPARTTLSRYRGEA